MGPDLPDWWMRAGSLGQTRTPPHRPPVLGPAGRAAWLGGLAEAARGRQGCEFARARAAAGARLGRFGQEEREVIMTCLSFPGDVQSLANRKYR